MGLGALIVAGLSTAGAFIGGVVSKIGPTVSKFANGFLGVVAKIPQIDLETVKVIIDSACNIIHSICEILGVESEKDPAELGAKVEQAEKTLDDFDNDTEAYIKYLKEEIELDKEKFDKMNSEEKMGCKTIGLALEAKAVEEKIGGVQISPEYISTLAKIQLGGNLIISAKDLINIICELKEAGITNMSDVSDYFEGKGDSDRIKTGEVLRNAVSKIENIENPKQYIEDMKQAARKYEEE